MGEHFGYGLESQHSLVTTVVSWTRSTAGEQANSLPFEAQDPGTYVVHPGLGSNPPVVMDALVEKPQLYWIPSA